MSGLIVQLQSEPIRGIGKKQIQLQRQIQRHKKIIRFDCAITIRATQRDLQESDRLETPDRNIVNQIYQIST